MLSAVCVHDTCACLRRGGSRAPLPPVPDDAARVTAQDALEAVATRLLAGAARQIPLHTPGGVPPPGGLPLTGPPAGGPALGTPAEGALPDQAQVLGSKLPRVGEAARRAVALEAPVPEYALPPAGGRGAGAARRRLFKCAAREGPGGAKHGVMYMQVKITALEAPEPQYALLRPKACSTVP